MINKQQIKGILFDMDGLILDTEKLYCRFWQEAARILGYPMTMEQALGMRSLNRHAGEAKLKSYFGEGISYTEVREKRIELMDAFVEKRGSNYKARNMGAVSIFTRKADKDSNRYVISDRAYKKISLIRPFRK